MHAETAQRMRRLQPPTQLLRRTAYRPLVTAKIRVAKPGTPIAQSGGINLRKAVMISHLESFTYDDDIVRKFVVATLVWGVVAMAAGVFLAVLLTTPTLGAGIPYLTFGRLRPVHTNAAIFAFAGNAIFAAVY